jgi:hypothetical protein
MKQYIWAGIAVLLVSAHASDNPFDLKENFGKLDKEQKVLLSELKRLAELKELAEEEAAQEPTVDETNEKKEVVIPTPILEESENKIVKSLDAVIEEEPVTSENRLNAMRQNALDTSKKSLETQVVTSDKTKVSEAEKEAQEKQALLAAVKQKEAELQQIRAEELRKVEAKKDAERREVEAYEKQRAEKLARKKAEEAAALEKEALAQNAAKSKQVVQEEVKKKQELEKVAIVKSQKHEAQKETLKKEEFTEAKQRKEDKKTSIVDINVTREKQEAKVSADQAYEDAVKEMSEED